MKLFLKTFDETGAFALHDENGNRLPGQLSTKVISEANSLRVIEVTFYAVKDDGAGVIICGDEIES